MHVLNHMNGALHLQCNNSDYLVELLHITMHSILITKRYIKHFKDTSYIYVIQYNNVGDNK
jgi:hypothetical protein